ncbi:hypothetical protein F2Q69_00030231 [Brassica cretica]|uniref:Uncharacterized protein n=1 Tax=Brassica cretica TaxID=69181 RepID=A0A8S9S9C5_BRACR|nr:hypothetical protein F2Q69_00030231 [Brassica cretica]
MFLDGLSSRRWSEWGGTLGFSGVVAWCLVTILCFTVVQRRRQIFSAGTCSGNWWSCGGGFTKTETDLPVSSAATRASSPGEHGRVAGRVADELSRDTGQLDRRARPLEEPCLYQRLLRDLFSDVTLLLSSFSRSKIRFSGHRARSRASVSYSVGSVGWLSDAEPWWKDFGRLFLRWLSPQPVFLVRFHLMVPGSLVLILTPPPIIGISRLCYSGDDTKRTGIRSNEARHGFLLQPERQRNTEKKDRWPDGTIQGQDAHEGKKETVLWPINGEFMNDPLMGFDHY